MVRAWLLEGQRHLSLNELIDELLDGMDKSWISSYEACGNYGDSETYICVSKEYNYIIIPLIRGRRIIEIVVNNEETS